jgi:hypothetical protein
MIKRMPPKRHSNSPKTMDFTMTYCPDQVRTQHLALLMTAKNEYIVRALRITSTYLCNYVITVSACGTRYRTSL